MAGVTNKNQLQVRLWEIWLIRVSVNHPLVVIEIR